MMDTEGAALDVAPDDRSEPALPVFDRTRPRLIAPVTIMLDRERSLRLPFHALLAFEQASGISPWDFDKVWGYPPSVKTLVLLLWAALIDEDPDLTIAQVERLPGVEFANVHYIRDKLDACWGANQPDPEPTTTTNGPAPKGSRLRG